MKKPDTGSRTETRSRFISLAGCAVVAAIAATGVLAGIQGSGFRMAAIGTLDTRGGFTVNGVAYDVSHARVMIDGVPANPAALRAGHVITVKGTVSMDGATGSADDISLVTDVRGAVSEVDASAGTITVLGQTIRVVDSAVLAGLEPGVEIASSGYTNAEGELIANRVDAEPSGAESQVRGVVADLDATMRSFEINGLAVDYSGAAVSGALTSGAIVTVRGSPASEGFALLATRVDVAAPLGSPGEKGDVAGLVTRYVSESDFDVNGLHVTTDEATKIYVSTAGLGLDSAVTVKGRFDATGLLIADQIHVDAATSRSSAAKAKAFQSKASRPQKPKS
jgi:hypothetical protein